MEANMAAQMYWNQTMEITNKDWSHILHQLLDNEYVGRGDYIEVNNFVRVVCVGRVSKYNECKILCCTKPKIIICIRLKNYKRYLITTYCK